jgi:tyrosine-protein kinase Etk/Wzc
VTIQLKRGKYVHGNLISQEPMTTETLIPGPNEQTGPADTSLPLDASETQEERTCDQMEEEEISILDLMIRVAERKRLVFGITIIFAVLAIIISLLLPVSYTATVALLPPQQTSSMSSTLASQIGGLSSMAALAGGSLGLKNPNDMFVSMLKSRTVEDAMVQKYRLMDEYQQRYLSGARKAFESHTTVDGSGKDGLIRISLEDRDAHRAAELANGYVDQFRSLSEHLAITEASQRRLFFEQQLQRSKDGLATAEEDLKRTEQTTGVIQLDSQSRALIETAAAIRAQISEREVQIQGMQTYATGENAQLLQAQEELAGLRAQLAKLGGSEDSATGGLLVPKGKVPEASLQYIRAYREVKYNETIFEIIARQFEAAKLDEARQGALIQVVDPAIPPDRRSFPKRALIVLGATAAGFLIGIFFALFQSSFARLKSDPESSEKLLQFRRALSIKRGHNIT